MYIKNRAKSAKTKGLCLFAKPAIFLICILENKKLKIK